MALIKLGFTPRQARFLVLALLHAGVCVPRQYRASAGIVHGYAPRRLFDRLLAERWAMAYPLVASRAQLYHLHHKALYRAVGDPDNRHRRPTTIARAIERLMVLDLVLAHPHIQWMATERDKAGYFTAHRGLDARDLPHVTFRSGVSTTARYFADKLPIGRSDTTDEVVLACVATDDHAEGLQRFLDDHRPLLSRLPRWRVLLGIPKRMADAAGRFERVAHRFTGPPLPAEVLRELQWYCRMRAAVERGHHEVHTAEVERYRTARRAFGSRRFFRIYRRWREHGDAALTDLRTSPFHEAARRGDIRVDLYVLPHPYYALAGVAGTA